MKYIFIILIFLAGIYQPATAQVTTTEVSAVSAVSADSVQMVPDMSKADELFLFKNNDGVATSEEKSSRNFEKTGCSACPFRSNPNCCPMAIACEKLNKSVMLAQIK